MKIWVDDIRPAPEGYIWVKSVRDALVLFGEFSDILNNIFWSTIRHREIIDHVFAAIKRDSIIDLDHDAGDFSSQGGDYIKILNWLEQTTLGSFFKFHIHSMNPVGVENMRKIIKKNHWEEI